MGDKKADAKRFVDEAARVVDYAGFLEFDIPGSSLVADSLLGKENSQWLGVNTKENRERSLPYLAVADSLDPQLAEAAVEARSGRGCSSLCESVSDVAAAAVGWQTSVLLERIAPRLASGTWYSKAVALGLSLMAAGATKDVAADGRLGTATDWLRGAGAYGGARLFLRSIDRDLPSFCSAFPSPKLVAKGSLFGAGREALYIGTGQKQVDGSEYGLGSAIGDVIDSGGQVGLSTLVIGSMLYRGKALLPQSLVLNTLPRIGLATTGLLSPGMQDYAKAVRLQDAWKSYNTMLDGYGTDRSSARIALSRDLGLDKFSH